MFLQKKPGDHAFRLIKSTDPKARAVPYAERFVITF
jgi:hypothetical protein